jgi:hypothetical protein
LFSDATAVCPQAIRVAESGIAKEGSQERFARLRANRCHVGCCERLGHWIVAAQEFVYPAV